MVTRTRASVVRCADALVRQVLEKEEAVVAATAPEELSKLDPELGRPSAALDAAALWVAMGRDQPHRHERLLCTEWERRRGESSAPAVRVALRRIEGPRSAGDTLVGGRGRVALHKSWAELTGDEQDAAEMLGWWKKAWADAAAPTVRGTRTDGLVATFADLRPEQKHAARVLRLNSRTWELLAAADAAQDRRIRAEAAKAEAAAQMSDSESENGIAADGDGSSDGGGDQPSALGDTTEEEDAIQYAVREDPDDSEDSIQEGGSGDGLSAQRAAVERAAEQLKAELRERRASNLALQEEASRAAVDPPWRGHSARTGWIVVRQPQRKDRSQYCTTPGRSKPGGRGNVATVSGQHAHSGTSDCRLDADALPLTPRSQVTEEPQNITQTLQQDRKAALRQRQRDHAYGLGQSHSKNAAAWLKKRAGRIIDAHPHSIPGSHRCMTLPTEPDRVKDALVAYQASEEVVSANKDARESMSARPWEAGHHMHQAQHAPPPRCCDDERVWVRSAVASLSFE